MGINLKVASHSVRMKTSKPVGAAMSGWFFFSDFDMGGRISANLCQPKHVVYMSASVYVTIFILRVVMTTPDRK
jgi:hypothetical protein